MEYNLHKDVVVDSPKHDIPGVISGDAVMKTSTVESVHLGDEGEIAGDTVSIYLHASALDLNGLRTILAEGGGGR